MNALVSNSILPKKYICLSGFYAITTLIGISYSIDATWNTLFGSIGSFLRSLAVLLGLFLLYYAILLAGRQLKRHAGWFTKRVPHGRVETFFFEAHPFLGATLVYAILMVPYVVAYYPGTLQSDAFEQLWKYLGVMDNDGKHSVVSTALMGRSLWLSRVVYGQDSDNLGFFTYTLVQSIFQVLIFSYLMLTQKRLKAPIFLRYATFFFLGIFPLFPRYGYTMVKDTPYYLMMLLFLTAMVNLLILDKGRKYTLTMALFALSAAGIVLFRKEGRYLLAISLLVFFIAYRRQWKAYLAAAILSFSLLFLVEGFYMPANHLESGAVGEALSLPLQQTARYHQMYADEVTDGEAAVLNEVFAGQYDSIEYVSWNSDSTKLLFLPYPTSEQLQSYFQVWFAQFLKHPTCYLQAYFAQTYGYFDPLYVEQQDNPPYFTLLLGRDALTYEEFSMELSFEGKLLGMRETLEACGGLREMSSYFNFSITPGCTRIYSYYVRYLFLGEKREEGG